MCNLNLFVHQERVPVSGQNGLVYLDHLESVPGFVPNDGQKFVQG